MNLPPRLLFAFVLVTACAFADEPRPVGVAKIDITPDYPVRLSGYGSRRTPHESVQQRIFAKALAFGSDADGPAVLVTVDNCGVPGAMRDEVVRQLRRRKRKSSTRASPSHPATLIARRCSSACCKSAFQHGHPAGAHACDRALHARTHRQYRAGRARRACESKTRAAGVERRLGRLRDEPPRRDCLSSQRITTCPCCASLRRMGKCARSSPATPVTARRCRSTSSTAIGPAWGRKRSSASSPARSCSRRSAAARIRTHRRAAPPN